jgi:dihydroorotase
VIGLETSFAVVNELVRRDELSALELMRRMSTDAARIFGLPGGTLAEGAAADVVMLDPKRVWRYDPAVGYSKSRNSPWAGHELTGQVAATWVQGRLVYRAGRGVVTA